VGFESSANLSVTPNSMAQLLKCGKRKPKHGFGVNGVVVAFGTARLHVPSADIQAALAAGSAIHDGSTTVGLVNDASRKRVLPGVFRTSDSSLTFSSLLHLLADLIPLRCVIFGLHARARRNHHGAVVLNEPWVVILVTIGVGEDAYALSTKATVSAIGAASHL
jgi:hypothetical protein